ncbi:hypothetical protein B0F90DRAFT_1814618 [Multifurca ochricompacta]|uniref:Uncharacterized protein n=1 Tax=Multifurca ochricompacta TaxID=376703 RepID=A0AAD4MAX3_9AGAM|nr:hypothetical protein B0F90DRAFT_1814618 [Multifurca ochricompacta]
MSIPTPPCTPPFPSPSSSSSHPHPYPHLHPHPLPHTHTHPHPHPYSSPSRRRPQPHLERPLAGISISKPLHAHSPPPHARAQSLRAQGSPALTTLHIPLRTPALESSPISPSDPGSPMSTAAPLTPAPEFLHVVCNAPLLAPKPLPYRPPTFLDSFELPDPDEDLSHPPYTRTSSKRKRTRDVQDDSPLSSLVFKRRATQSVFRGLNGLGSQRRFSNCD